MDRFFVNPYAADPSLLDEIKENLSNEDSRHSLSIRILHRCMKLILKLQHFHAKVSTSSPNLYTSETPALGLVLDRLSQTILKLRNTLPADIIHTFPHLNNFPNPLPEDETTETFANRAREMAEHLFKKCIQNTETHHHKHVNTYLTGTVGIHAELLSLLSRNPLRNEMDDYWVRKCMTEIRAAIKPTQTKFLEYHDELLYGKAGLLYALLYVEKTASNLGISHQFHVDIKELSHSILESGTQLTAEFEIREWPVIYEFHGCDYLGAAHGLVGVLTVLNYVRLIDNDLKERIDTVIDKSVALLAKIQFESGNFPSRVTKLGDDKLVQWCHGFPGCVSLLHTYKDDPRIKVAIERGLDDVWNRGLLQKGLGICHGIGGNGYAFLQCVDMNNDNLVRATAFAEYGWDHFEKLFHVPDHPYSVYEGFAGFICFQLDLLLAIENESIFGIPGYDL